MISGLGSSYALAQRHKLAVRPPLGLGARSCRSQRQLRVTNPLSPCSLGMTASEESAPYPSRQILMSALGEIPPGDLDDVDRADE